MGLRPSLFLTPIPSLPPTIVSTSSSPSPLSLSPTRVICIGVRNKFTTSDGNNCSSYDYESSDYYDDFFDDDDDYYENGCSNDTDPFTNYYAKDVCAECGECSDPLIANTSPPTVSLPPTVTHSSSPSPPPTVSRGPTSSPIVTFLPIEGSTCSDTCGAKRKLVKNYNVKERV